MSMDAAILGRALRAAVTQDECRVCHCKGDSCSLADGERCVWVDSLRTLCNNPGCLRDAGNAKRRHRREVERADRDAKNQPLRRRNKKRKVKGRAA